MAKEDFTRRVLEEQIFNELKDTIIKSARYLRAKYEGSDVNVSRLYRRIVNYQNQKNSQKAIFHFCRLPRSEVSILSLTAISQNHKAD